MQMLAATPDELDIPSQSLFGLAALEKEIVSQGVAAEELFAGSGLSARQLNDPAARMSRRQRLTIYRNAKRLARSPDIAIVAGERQRLSDYGLYGYAFASCPTLREAVLFSVRNLRMACPVLQIRYREQDDGVILSSHGGEDVWDILPFCTEYWRSSQVTMLSRAIEAPLRSRRMLFPYPAPGYWRAYERAFNCPVEFEAGALEWHIDNETLDQACASANPVNAGIFEAMCAQLVQGQGTGTGLARRIRMLCLETCDAPSAAEMAERVNMSVRSMFRRLAAEGTSYQLIIDDVRRGLAMEQLRNRSRSIEEVSRLLGFTEASNFSKVFKRWTGLTPGEYRDSLCSVVPAVLAANDEVDSSLY